MKTQIHPEANHRLTEEYTASVASDWSACSPPPAATFNPPPLRATPPSLPSSAPLSLSTSVRREQQTVEQKRNPRGVERTELGTSCKGHGHEHGEQNRAFTRFTLMYSDPLLHAGLHISPLLSFSLRLCREGLRRPGLASTS
ncbi:hypothetical protein D9C73_000260 [Collichthys lucidus]|uniref:Uncharacterized protein n=1 Tax=Collichthys lucidus TaxID=240159 RepID=A0A4U5TX11_COLLU|nr:hypothetical protein D9C73_000260 [Collichthys lucidus]